MAVKISEIGFKGWEHCVEITNGSIKLIVTTDVGPRIIFFGFCDGENELFEVEEDIGKTGGSTYRLYGGHRLWHAPQDDKRTVELDNTTISWNAESYKFCASQPVEAWSMIKKDIEITMHPDKDEVEILHKLTNKGAWGCELALWASKMMAPGGLEIIPFSNGDAYLAPNRSIALWSWTKFNDPKIKWGDKYLFIKQMNLSNKVRNTGLLDTDDPWGCWTNPIKIGINNEQGWAAYINNGNLFVLKYNHIHNGDYTDMNSSYETFSCDYMTEMESLSPLRRLGQDESVKHIEEWKLIRNIREPLNDREVDKIILKHI